MEKQNLTGVERFVIIKAQFEYRIIDTQKSNKPVMGSSDEYKGEKWSIDMLKALCNIFNSNPTMIDDMADHIKFELNAGK